MNKFYQSRTADFAQNGKCCESFFRGAGEGCCIVSEIRVGSGSLLPRPGDEETTRLKVNQRFVSTSVFTELCVGGL